ncbi:hypothetical protein TVAGG3_0362450 [Trichomonas vaginalis G3]|uniref:hypothetical protein n=1 Tax=Trichomonas vaginalis (strain ATCC PRA-98 / G3) TaxID=412133 RepID=UPI0021E61671|nr:hypothetical protein TVAGG3_0362450 [Trichomonas vaginalis G3]KAI5532039.1 hypothetical protein TVAGG3_0362450 [Trichomonas vaginalis G3]
MSPQEYSSISGSKYYQVPLFGILNLESNSRHTIDIKTVKGTTGISGLLADGDLVDLVPSSISSSPSHTDEEDFELYTNSDQNNPDPNPKPDPEEPTNNKPDPEPEPENETPGPTKDVKPVNPEVKTPEPTEKQPEPEKPEIKTPEQTAEKENSKSPTPSQEEIDQQLKDTEHKKKVYIGVGAGLGAAAVVAAIAIVAVIVIKTHSKGYERKVGDEDENNYDL